MKNNSVGDNKHELTGPLLFFLVLFFGEKIEIQYEIIDRAQNNM